MRRPSRNIEIFSMSVLDMFASALGAFIMIAVILFPYYDRHKLLENTQKEIEAVAAMIDRLQSTISSQQETLEENGDVLARLEVAQKASNQCEAKKSICLATLSTTFLVVGIEWDDAYDVDLLITDPTGSQYRFNTPYGTGPGAGTTPDEADAFLSLDVLTGPGTEIFQAAHAKHGVYKIAVRAQALDGADGIAVRSWIIDRTSGKIELGSATIPSGFSTVTIADIRVNDDGSIDVDVDRMGSRQ